MFIGDTVLLVYLSLKLTTPGLLLGMFMGGTVLQESVLGVYFSTLKVFMNIELSIQLIAISKP